MINKKISHIAQFSICLVFLFLIMGSVSAVTGKIGNGRMVLSMETGDTIERYVNVISDNDEPVNISVFVTGDLKDEFNLDKTSFILEPNEEKKVYFLYKAKEPGTYETKINVQFSSLTAKNGVGLASTVIINVYGEGSLPDDTDDSEGDLEDDTDSVNLISTTGSAIKDIGFGFKPIYILGISTMVLLAVFLVMLYFIYSKKMRGVKGGVAHESKIKREIKK